VNQVAHRPPGGADVHGRRAPGIDCAGCPGDVAPLTTRVLLIKRTAQASQHAGLYLRTVQSPTPVQPRREGGAIPAECPLQLEPLRMLYRPVFPKHAWRRRAADPRRRMRAFTPGPSRARSFTSGPCRISTRTASRPWSNPRSAPGRRYNGAQSQLMNLGSPHPCRGKIHTPGTIMFISVTTHRHGLQVQSCASWA
jgi:hypothetical protein